MIPDNVYVRKAAAGDAEAFKEILSCCIKYSPHS